MPFTGDRSVDEPQLVSTERSGRGAGAGVSSRLASGDWLGLLSLSGASAGWSVLSSLSLWSWGEREGVEPESSRPSDPNSLSTERSVRSSRREPAARSSRSRRCLTSGGASPPCPVLAAAKSVDHVTGRRCRRPSGRHGPGSGEPRSRSACRRSRRRGSPGPSAPEPRALPGCRSAEEVRLRGSRWPAGRPSRPLCRPRACSRTGRTPLGSRAPPWSRRTSPRRCPCGGSACGELRGAVRGDIANARASAPTAPAVTGPDGRSSYGCPLPFGPTGLADGLALESALRGSGSATRPRRPSRPPFGSPVPHTRRRRDSALD